MVALDAGREVDPERPVRGIAERVAGERVALDDEPRRIAVVLPDSGERYVSTPFFAPEPPATVRA